MDPNSLQNPNSPPPPPVTDYGLTSEPRDNKKVLIIAGVVVFVILGVILLIFLNSRSGSQKTQNTPTNGTNSGANTRNGSIPENNLPKNDEDLGENSAPANITQTPQNSTPEDVAENFYAWYISTPDVLGSGAYKTRSDITQDMKENMGRFERRGIKPEYDHIFNCGVAPHENVTFSKATLSDRKDKAQVLITDADSKNKLFQIILIKNGSNWLVDDVWCS